MPFVPPTALNPGPPKPKKGKFSFKLNAYLQSVFSTFGTDYWHTWYGVVALPDYVTLLQFGLGGAVCFDFPKKQLSYLAL
jgi:hypothetical protein